MQLNRPRLLSQTKETKRGIYIVLDQIDLHGICRVEDRAAIVAFVRPLGAAGAMIKGSSQRLPRLDVLVVK